jgi:hypothetical protein
LNSIFDSKGFEIVDKTGVGSLPRAYFTDTYLCILGLTPVSLWAEFGLKISKSAIFLPFYSSIIKYPDIRGSKHKTTASKNKIK